MNKKYAMTVEVTAETEAACDRVMENWTLFIENEIERERMFYAADDLFCIIKVEPIKE